MKFMVINGPNINMIGVREKGIYGSKSFTEICEYIKEEGLYDDNSISSYSIGGDLTVNEKESQDMADKLNISKLAFFYLKRTGLTNRII